MRAHVVPRDPKTQRQRESRAAFAALVAAWRGLDEGGRAAWNGYARGRYASGFNAFLSVGLRRLKGAEVRGAPAGTRSKEGPSTIGNSPGP